MNLVIIIKNINKVSFIKMKIPGVPNKQYRRSDASYLLEQDILDIISMRNTIPNAAQIAAKKYKTSTTRIYQIWRMQGEITQQPPVNIVKNIEQPNAISPNKPDHIVSTHGEDTDLPNVQDKGSGNIEKIHNIPRT